MRHQATGAADVDHLDFPLLSRDHIPGEGSRLGVFAMRKFDPRHCDSGLVVPPHLFHEVDVRVSDEGGHLSKQ